MALAATGTGGGGGGGGAATIADGADVAEGATTDAVVAAGAAGTISAKLRRLTTDLSTVATNTTGLATAAGQTSAQTLTGAVTETAPATDTASSGLNGRLQRIAQRLTSLIAQIPATLGIKASTASLPVVIASDDAQFGAKTTASVINAGGSGVIGWLSDAVTQLKSLVTGVVVAAGTNLIGKVGIDQTTPGTTNKVSIGTDGTVAINAALPAGTNLIGKVGIDQTTPGTTNGVAAQATENMIGKTVGIVVTPSTTVTRPANTTAYASGQLLANSTTAGSVTALQFTSTRLAAGSATIRRGRLSKTSTTTAVSAFRLHLFSASPLAPTNGDGGVFIPLGAANYLGVLDFPSMIACTDGAAGNGAPLVGSDITFALGSGQTVFGLIEVRAAYVPTSGEVFTAVLEIFQN
jgi:hypothetical protein